MRANVAAFSTQRRSAAPRRPSGSTKTMLVHAARSSVGVCCRGRLVGAERLWHAWKSIDRATDQPLDAHHYLTLHAETGISLRTIWRQIQRWVAYGGLDANG